MVKIYTAIYRIKGREASITVDDLNLQKYYAKYRRKLFCSTDNCNAMISYVTRSGKRSFFRTWRGNVHAEHCIFHSIKVFGEEGLRIFPADPIYLGESQMTQSMKQAYQLELRTANEETMLIKAKPSAPRKQKLAVEGIEQMSWTLTTDPAFKNKSENGRKGKLYKRDIDALTVRDIGKTRTIIGRFIEADLSGNRPVIRIEKNGIYANLLFEEAFFAEVTAARERLPSILKYTEVFAFPIIVAVGEVRANKSSVEYEIAMFEYKALMVDGQSLDALAVRDAVQQLSFLG